jgi:predicted MFS family arabinose efflux permease
LDPFQKPGTILKQIDRKAQARILTIVVFAQFVGISLWFAGNAVMTDLQRELNMGDAILGHLTSAIQLGFILGTLVFALFTLSDRFSPSKVFFVCALAGAISNAGVYFAPDFTFLMLFRLITGFFLAGIYPVGMKIASDYHLKGLGKALGYLLGALVVGTAFPHLLKTLTQALPWRYVILITSVLATMGGFMVLLFVPDGPFRKKSHQLDLMALFTVFKGKEFRSAAFGYFGHMWELYTFWAFVPVILGTYLQFHPSVDFDISLFSFLIIGIGAVGCVFGGHLSLSLGSKFVAFIALFVSGLCCLLSPLFFQLPVLLFFLFLFIWGFSVISDSPQFSTLVAKTAPKESIGTALTIVNSIGFAITIISIQLVSFMSTFIDHRYLYLVLAIGPVVGLFAMNLKIRNSDIAQK